MASSWHNPNPQLECKLSAWCLKLPQRFSCDVTKQLSLAYMLRYVSIDLYIYSVTTLFSIWQSVANKKWCILMFKPFTQQTRHQFDTFFSVKLQCQTSHAHPVFRFACLHFQRRGNVDIIQSGGFILCTEAHGDALNSLWVKTAGRSTNEHRSISSIGRPIIYCSIYMFPFYTDGSPKESSWSSCLVSALRGWEQFSKCVMKLNQWSQLANMRDIQLWELGLLLKQLRIQFWVKQKKKKIYVLLACGIRRAPRGGLDGVVRRVAHHHGGSFSK